MLFKLDKKSLTTVLKVALNTLLHHYHFVQLFQNLRIRKEHSIPSTNALVPIRFCRFSKIFKNFPDKNGECKRTKNTKIFVCTKCVACVQARSQDLEKGAAFLKE